MNYIILAAGLGQRLQPLTSTTPKALLTVAGKALLHWHLQKIYHPSNHIFINTSWLAEQIHAYVKTHFPRVQCIYEGQPPLGSGDGILNVYQQMNLKQGVIIINADIFCDYEVAALTPSSGMAHLVMVDNPAHNKQGDFGLTKNRLCLESTVKKTYAGLAFLSDEFINQLRQSHRTSKMHSFIPLINQLSQQQQISAEIHAGFWFDVGTPQRLQQANDFAALAKC